MQDAQGEVLYIGKARNLKKRVSSYFQKKQTSARLAALVEQIRHIDIIVTRNESEALILECQLIKKCQPRYNILLRDDKSFPYIVLSHHDFPRLFIQRSNKPVKSSGAQYFGPYPGTTALHATMDLIQKIFHLRVCRDSFFAHRTRPCLLYQIKKCTAPCVNYISPENYQADVRAAELLLKGKNQEILKQLIARMEDASHAQNYEQAALLRDQIASLRHIQAEQAVKTFKNADADVFAVMAERGVVAVEVLAIRDGQLLGNQAFYPRLPAGDWEIKGRLNKILAQFIPQYYLQHAIPGEIILAAPLPQQNLLADALSQLSGKNIKMTVRPRAERAEWLEIAQNSLMQAVSTRLASDKHYQSRLNALREALQLPEAGNIARMECFDISHTSGEATVASCVVFDQHGSVRKSWRRFNIANVTPGDDYAAMRQALKRRYQQAEAHTWPDILFIDGGKGQLRQAEEVLRAFNISGILLVGIAKGPSRKAGLEQLFIAGREKALILPEDSEALHLIQQIRDEAHRFAITGHRKKRAKIRQQSVLENIPGIGAKKRAELLRQLGGLQEVRRASIADLQKVPGISEILAKQIYQYLHDE